MLPLFDFSITFNKSNDFLRCILLSHIAAAGLLFFSAFHAIIITLFLILLGASLLYTYRNTSPQPHCKKLTYHQKFWLLDYHDGNQSKLDAVQVRFDGGFFLLLLLVGKHSKKHLVVFNDQLTQAQHRTLKVLSQIT